MQLAKIVTGGSIIPPTPEGVKWTDPSQIISTLFTVVIVKMLNTVMVSM